MFKWILTLLVVALIVLVLFAILYVAFANVPAPSLPVLPTTPDHSYVDSVPPWLRPADANPTRVACVPPCDCIPDC